MNSSSRARTRTLFKALALLAALGIGGWLLFDRPVTAENSTPSASGGQSGAVATIGSTKVSESELEDFLSAQLMQLRRQRQQILADGLDQYLSQRVLDKEAEAEGISTTALLKQEVTDKVADPTDAEVDAFYEGNKDRISVPKEQVADRIKQFLKQQRQQKAYADYIESLKKKYQVKVLMEPMRLDVDSAKAPSEGPTDAPVTIVEFSDFQCPFCARVNPTLEQVVKTYGDKVRLVYRQFPLQNLHPNAQVAAEASLCAREQGKFWEMHDAMFGNQQALAAGQLKATAAKLGLDADKFGQCLDSGKYKGEINADMKAAAAAGVNSTPSLFVNGRPLRPGALPYEEIAKVIDEELARQQQNSDSSGS